MTFLSLFKIRLVAEHEKPQWKDKLKEAYYGDEGDVHFIFVQWDASKAKGEAPAALDEGATYRSVIIKKMV